MSINLRKTLKYLFWQNLLYFELIKINKIIFKLLEMFNVLTYFVQFSLYILNQYEQFYLSETYSGPIKLIISQKTKYNWLLLIR